MGTLLLLSVFFTGCAKEKHVSFTLFDRALHKEKLVVHDGVYYRRGRKIPYSGGIFAVYSTGGLEMEAILEDGVPDGKIIYWYESGQKQKEVLYIAGKREGVSTLWYETGQTKKIVTYENNQMNGISISWDHTGQKQYEKYYRNNRMESSLRYTNEVE